MRRAGLDHTGTPGRVDENSGHAVWGVSLIWDTRRVRAMGDAVVVVPHRVIRMEVEIVGDKTGTPMTVYGVYMPQRSGAAEEVDDVWQQLHDDAIKRDGVWVMGDMNAERERVVRAKGKSVRKADQHLEDLIEHVGMTYTGEGRPTHRSGTEIDHILVANEQAGGVSKARLAPGVSGRDHQLVWVDVTYQVDAEGCGPARTVGPPINRLGKQAWEQYEKRVGAWWIETRAAWRAKGGGERARDMQAALAAVARQLLRDDEEAKKSERQQREAA